MNNEQKIRLENNVLIVPNFPVIPFIEGDGIGAEVWAATQAVVDAAVLHAYDGQCRIEWMEVFAGDKAHQLYGTYLPKETVDTLADYTVAIKGPLATPVGGGIRSLNVTLRQKLDLYVCMRPVRYFKGAPSPIVDPEKVNMIIFRENTEDTYAGIEFQAESEELKKLLAMLQFDFPETYAKLPFVDAELSIGFKPISRPGSERIVRAALEHAITNDLPSVTIVHKGNIMKCTEGSFFKWAIALAAREYGATPVGNGSSYEFDNPVSGATITIKSVIADAFFEKLLTHPDEHSVVVTTNLNGDYISDAASGTIGGLGISPGANINPENGHAIFEATHGTAPDIAGQNKANPCSLILSAVLMLRYIGWIEAAQAIVDALEHTLADEVYTSDFYHTVGKGRLVGTDQFATLLIDHINRDEPDWNKGL
ncbi:MAG: NADP-dependent isocitrate dehydrogenase [bacterium]|nr:NADP-dependent isocitrate dehydrogenase [bacterium]